MKHENSKRIYEICHYLHILMDEHYEHALIQYIKELELWNVHYHLVSYKNEDELVQKHIIDSIIAIPLLQRFVYERFPKNSTIYIADIGSGGGFPIVLLALYMPQWQFVALERSQKKANFLRIIKGQLQLHNLTIYAEDFQYHTQQYHIIVSRGFHTFTHSFTHYKRLLHKKGMLFLYKGIRSVIENDIMQLQDIDIQASIGIHPLVTPYTTNERHIVTIF